jgi:hypothetical protein
MKSVPLPIDVMNVQAVPATNPAQLVIVDGNTTDNIGPIGVLAPNVAVFISNFTSSPSNIALDNTVNSTLGIYATTVIDLTHFTINTSFAAVTSSTVAPMVIGKNRIAFPLRFTTVNKGVTNTVKQIHT